ncbi:hypothetical protein OIDMADRAFT_32200 [Oidiodendron maius Zn]|uniref:Uncharacterized protein n=1 Tax=Oidiodendron maius (strain Zn) TaxID=913774 RepID=A0A0C3GM35_OIDMZ|nr:hypothetical protein OIDMADRAFT_32200 [Oidiodendron maius Zn]
MKFLLISTLIAFASTTYSQLCVGQGLGYCQGVYACWIETLGDGDDCAFTIYDSYCNNIGEKDGPNVGDAVDSQLPYTVDLVELRDSASTQLISAQFWYAGGEYGTGISGYDIGKFTSGLSAGAYMRSSFPC